MESNKKSGKDVYKKKGLYFNIGLVVSLAVVLTAFEWRTVVAPSQVVLDNSTGGVDIIDMKITKIDPPKPPQPKVKNFTIKAVSDKTEVDPVEFDIPDPDDIVVEPTIDLSKPEVKEEVVETVLIAEHMPSFGGDGQMGFLKYIQGKLKYPQMAKRHHVEGKVFVQFVIDIDGKMRDVEVLRGIGYGCDEEVVRLIEEAPAWEPGKQRGNPVRVRMVLPIQFKLQ